MALFKKAEMTSAYLKMGIYGDAGSGKTYTASQVAKGLALHIKASGRETPPVMFIDTETGSNWVKPVFDAVDIDFLVAQTRAFSDLKEAVREAEAAGAILIVDSISHFWQEVQEAYVKSKQERTRKPYAKLEFQDYAILKPLWAQFTGAYLNSRAHIILCGRAGGTYEYQENEETHKKELITTGTKMRAEKDMGYEPSLLVEMVIEKDPDDKRKKKSMRKAFVIKDRSTLLDGMEFLNPTFKSFAPHIERLNLGGAHAGFDASRSSSALFPKDDRDDRSLQRKVALDEIESLLVRYFPSTGGSDKKAKLDLLKVHFQASWTEMEKLMRLEDLRMGYDTLHRALEGEPSKYARDIEADKPLGDAIPDFEAKAEEKPKFAFRPGPMEWLAMRDQHCHHCGCEIERKKRSGQHHRMFFAVVAAAFSQWPEESRFIPDNAEHLRAWLLKEVKHCNTIGQNLTDEADIYRVADFTERLLNTVRAQGGYGFVEVTGPKSITVKYPKSISFREVGQKAFAAIAQACFDIIEAEVGVSVEQLVREEACAA